MGNVTRLLLKSGGLVRDITTMMGHPHVGSNKSACKFENVCTLALMASVTHPG